MAECSGNCVSCAMCTPGEFQAKYNNFEYSEEYKHPYAAIVSVTDACTNACPYCFVRFGTKRMSIETARQTCRFLIENAKFHGETPSLTFFGGEPLMEFDTIIRPIVEEFPEIGFSITTNGVLLTAGVVDFLYDHNVSILLSFDGVREVQDSGRPLKDGGSSFDKIMENIPYLVDIYGDKVMMRSTITKQSIPYLYKNFLFAQSLGFKAWAFAIDAFESYDSQDRECLTKELDKICHDISIALSTGHEVMRVVQVTSFFNKLMEIERNPSYDIDNSLFRCGMGTTATGISPEGLIIPCQEKNSKPEHAIGDVWTGIDEEKHAEYLQWYMDFTQKYHCPAPCRDKLKALCLNDICPSRMQDLGEYTPPSGACILTQALNRTVGRLYMKYAYSVNDYALMGYFQSPIYPIGGDFCGGTAEKENA